MTQEQEFLGEIKRDDTPMGDEQFADLLDKPKAEPPKAEEAKPEEGEEDAPKNRRNRRLEQKLQAEREANIALNARLQAMSEFKKFADEHPGEVDPEELQVFGTDEQGKMLKNYFTKKFQEIEERAEQRALDKIEADRRALAEEEAKNSQFIDSQFDEIEDQFNVDLSGSNKASRDLRDGFIDFFIKISPKGEDGEITEYADFPSAFETYMQLSSKEKPRQVAERQKELADRSMTQGGLPIQPKTPQGPTNFKGITRMLDSWREKQNY